MDNEIVGEVVLIDIAKIETNKGQIEGVSKNPRLIRNENYRKLVESLKRDPQFMRIKPFKVYQLGEKYVVIDGNMRYHAMKDKQLQNTWDRVPCIIIPQDTPKETLQRYVFLDNAQFGELDPDEISHFDKEFLAQFCIDVPAPDITEEDEAKEDDYDTEGNRPAVGKAKTKLGDIYSLGGHRLICGDSTDSTVLDALCGMQVADLLITDPPLQCELSKQEHRYENRK